MEILENLERRKKILVILTLSIVAMRYLEFGGKVLGM